MALKIRNVQDFRSGLMFMILGAAFGLGALKYSMGSASRMGPGYFPTILGWLTVILGIVIFIEAFKIEKDRPTAPAWRPLLGVLGGVSAFAYLVDTGGLISAVIACVMLSAIGGPDFRLKESLISSAVLSVTVWAIFDLALGLPFRLFPWSY